MSLLRSYVFATRRLVSESLVGNSAFAAFSRTAGSAAGGAAKSDKEPLRKAKTPQGRFDSPEKDSSENKDVLQRFPEDVNPETKEKGGPRGPEPTRYGDWERRGRCIDF